MSKNPLHDNFSEKEWHHNDASLNESEFRRENPTARA